MTTSPQTVVQKYKTTARWVERKEEIEDFAQDVVDEAFEASLVFPLELHDIARFHGVLLKELTPKLLQDISKIYKKDSDDIEGCLLKTPEKAIYVNVQGRSFQRQRFTAAHELGHLLLKHEEHEEVLFRSALPAAEQPWYEAEANHFAACLLIPKSELRTTKHWTMESKKTYFFVSEVTLRIREKGL